MGKKEMALTLCEQKYDYLFTKDFACGILRVVTSSKSISGIYIMSSGRSIKIKDILSFLENRISPQKKLLQIGALPYRPNQIMHMEGNSERFFQSFNFRPVFSVFEGLDEAINYYLNPKKNE
jgi:nucleoside-diphosphate-sugar epimerase